MASRDFEQLELESLLVEVENPNFIPCPRTSLELDKDKLGSCGICHQSQLRLRSGKRGITDETIAILPCAHVACYNCLKKSLAFNKSCPFCRVPLQYQLCGHASKLIRPITRENLFRIPNTMPMGGSIPLQCYECAVKTDERVHKYLLDSMLKKFQKLRSEYHAEADETKKSEIKLSLLFCKKLMDKAIDELAAYPARALALW
jgi:hypothetical protein